MESKKNPVSELYELFQQEWRASTNINNLLFWEFVDVIGMPPGYYIAILIVPHLNLKETGDAKLGKAAAKNDAASKALERFKRKQPVDPYASSASDASVKIALSQDAQPASSLQLPKNKDAAVPTSASPSLELPVHLRWTSASLLAKKNALKLNGVSGDAAEGAESSNSMHPCGLSANSTPTRWLTQPTLTSTVMERQIPSLQRQRYGMQNSCTTNEKTTSELQSLPTSETHFCVPKQFQSPDANVIPLPAFTVSKDIPIERRKWHASKSDGDSSEEMSTSLDAFACDSHLSSRRYSASSLMVGAPVNTLSSLHGATDMPSSYSSSASHSRLNNDVNGTVDADDGSADDSVTDMESLRHEVGKILKLNATQTVTYKGMLMGYLQRLTKSDPNNFVKSEVQTVSIDPISVALDPSLIIEETFSGEEASTKRMAEEKACMLVIASILKKCLSTIQTSTALNTAVSKDSQLLKKPPEDTIINVADWYQFLAKHLRPKTPGLKIHTFDTSYSDGMFKSRLEFNDEFVAMNSRVSQGRLGISGEPQVTKKKAEASAINAAWKMICNSCWVLRNSLVHEYHTLAAHHLTPREELEVRKVSSTLLTETSPILPDNMQRSLSIFPEVQAINGTTKKEHFDNGDNRQSGEKRRQPTTSSSDESDGSFDNPFNRNQKVRFPKRLSVDPSVAIELENSSSYNRNPSSRHGFAAKSRVKQAADVMTTGTTTPFVQSRSDNKILRNISCVPSSNSSSEEHCLKSHESSSRTLKEYRSLPKDEK